MRCLLRTLAVTVVFAVPAFAQDKPLELGQPTPPSPAAAPPNCADFRHNPDGSWSPVHPVTVGDVTISRKGNFAPGTVVGGVDIAAQLNQQCLQQP